LSWYITQLVRWALHIEPRSFTKVDHIDLAFGSGL
jgi:hypothetical protein